MRSNSRCSGSTSCDADTASPRARAIAAMRPSCTGFTNENSRQTASASAPLSSTRSSTADTSSSSSARSTLPSAATRSSTSKRRSSGMGGAARVGCSAYNSGRACRPMTSVSRKPRVVISAQRAPLRVSSVFVDTVEPCTTSSGRQPSADSASRIARPGSSGVEGRLCSRSAAPSQ